MPPILKGSEKEQIAAIRDYLVRVVRSNNNSIESAAEAAAEAALQTLPANRAGKKTAPERSVDDVRENFDNLKNLIIKNSQYVERMASEIQINLGEHEKAIGDFGEFVENAEANFAATAKGVIEEYNYDEAIRTLQNNLTSVEAFNEYQQSVRGQICRGIIIDPNTQEQTIGIAISENLIFTGTEHTIDGVKYYELNKDQTLGIYTSTGWQFWSGGVRNGWFNSSDSTLHVSNLLVESAFQLGDDWQISHTNGFGIKYIGG